jgi:hypothetical protein
MYQNKIIEKLIDDSTDKGSIKVGAFTLGELHSDRVCLFINLVDFIGVVYKLKETPIKYWHSPSESVGYYHFGITLNDGSSEVTLAGIFPEVILPKWVSNNSENLEKPKEYSALNEVLKIFNY